MVIVEIRNKTEGGVGMRIAFHTLGCKVNQYESQVLAAAFGKSGFEIVSAEEFADVYVVNSCTVTAVGDKKTGQILRRFRRQNPDAVIALTGCFPQAFPEQAIAMEQADIVRGTRNRLSLIDDVEAVLKSGSRIAEVLPHTRDEAFEEMTVSHFQERTRAFVKIEDGCDKYCAYCIIPKARGPIRSKPLESLQAELTELAAAGYREVVLVGINLSSYGKDLGCTLTDAVALAQTIDGIERIRLGSLEPELLTDQDITRLSQIPKFCPQFHLALQSGCDQTLKRMNRRYTAAEFAKTVDTIRKVFDNPSITTDIMVGFAGETTEEFAASLTFAEQIGFAKAHVFAYSRRSGTRADQMPNQLSKAEKDSRSRQMIEVTDRTRAAFLQTQVGRTETVLFESDTDGYAEGYTKNYCPVKVQSDNPLSGQIRSVMICEATADGLIGRLI